MKKTIKIILLIILSAFISAILVYLPRATFAAGPDNNLTLIDPTNPNNYTGQYDSIKYRYRETTKGDLIPAHGELYFDAMVEHAAYLCAWHGQHFFYWKPVEIKMHIDHFGVSRDEIYYPQTHTVTRQATDHFPDEMISKDNHGVNPQAKVVDNMTKERTVFFEPVSSIYSVYTGKVERTQIRYFMTNGHSDNAQPDDHTYDYASIVLGGPNTYIEVLNNTGLSLSSESYSGYEYYPTKTKDYNAVETATDEDGNHGVNNAAERRRATIITTGITRFTPTDVHYDKNNAMAFLLADVDDNEGKTPRGSYVNHNFWAHLYDTPTGTSNPHATGSEPPASTAENPDRPKGTENMPNISFDDSWTPTVNPGTDYEDAGYLPSGASASDISAAIVANETVLIDVKRYTEILSSGGTLTDEQCQELYNSAAGNLGGKESAEFYAMMAAYRDDKSNIEAINNFLSQISTLTSTMEEAIKTLKEAEEPKQNTNDFNQMWADIGEDYSLKVFDRTDQNAVTVEFDTTHQQYIIGPFNIEYIERYTSDFTLAGMAGDPVLRVNINGSPTTIKRSEGKWDFFYKGARLVDGVPGVTDGDTTDNSQDENSVEYGTHAYDDKYGYNAYPHNGEDFYIKLKYLDGLNSLLGLEVYFRYMQAESLWTRCKGEIEKLKFSVTVGYSECHSGSNSEGHHGWCDGGAYDIDGRTHNDSWWEWQAPYEGDHETGYRHWHVEDTPDGEHDMGRTASPYCDNYTPIPHYSCGHSCGSSCEEDGCDHSCDPDIGCDGYWTYRCDGHDCGDDESKGAKKCAHGFYAGHIESINLTIYGQFIEAIPIQDIGTCHWAWRMYYDITFRTSWDIDLTTMLEGDVWLDEVPQKANSIMEDGTGVWEDAEKNEEHGVENALVTIKVFKYKDGGADAEYVRDAIMHNPDGTVDNSWPKKTDSNGHYAISRLEPPADPAINPLDANAKSNCFYVAEFQYDGQVYESTIFLRNGDGDDTADDYMSGTKDSRNADNYKDKSIAVENATERKSFDAKFTETFGKDKMSGAEGGNTTNGQSTSVDDIKYNGKSQDDDSAKCEEDKNGATMIRSEFESAATKDHKDMEAGWEGTRYYNDYGLKSYTYYTGSTEATGADKKEYQIMFPMSDKGIQYGAGDVIYTLNNIRPDGNGVGKTRYINEYMLHINLGLQQRKESDISLIKDLYKMTIVVNEQEVVQNFNCLGPTPAGSVIELNVKDNDDYKTLKKALEDRRNKPNQLGLFNSDIAYSSKSRYSEAIDKVKKIKENTELRVFATYAVRVYNNSDTNDVTINEITDYYDSTYTLIDDENDEHDGNGVLGLSGDGVYTSIVKEDLERVNKLVANKPYYRVLPTTGGYEDISWKPTKEENLASSAIIRKDDLTWSTSGEVDGMKKSTTDSLKNVKLKVNQYAEIFTTYEIDNEGFDRVRASQAIGKRDNLVGEKNNVAEVSNYSTYYNAERDYKDAIDKGYYKPYKNSEQISGKIDKDSAPDNIPEILKESLYEDDTCRAIPLNIKAESTERDMYGYVFEDKKDKDLGKYELKVGNGIYDSGEYLIPNVKVSMFEVISLADCNHTLEEKANIALNDLEYYYEIPQDFYNEGNEVLTGNVPAGVEGNYHIKGFLPADYVLRFDYGINSDDKANLYSIDEYGNEITESDVPIIKYNGQDYENTSFLSETTYGTGSAINDKYLNLRTEDMKNVHNKPGIKAVTQVDGSKAYSTARDNETRRMVVNAFSRNIENDRGEILRDRRADDQLYVDATSMFAETPIMQIEVNQPKDLNEDTNLNSDEKTEVTKTIDGRKENFVVNRKYSIKNINFGLEERAKTDIRLEQYIESIFLLKEDDIIFSATLKEDGKVITEKADNKGLDKLTYLTHEEAINSNQQGFYAISVEDDYLNGLTMNIDYKIKMINESETDFTGYLADYDTPAKIIADASYSPTTEAYTRDIEELLDKENDAGKAGMATNATLAELFKIAGREQDGAILKELLKNDSLNSNIKDTIRPDIVVYGKYLGTYYYENTLNESGKQSIIMQYKWADMDDIPITYNMDRVVETTVDQLIDYIDTNASYELETQTIENCSWDLSGKLDSNTTERRTIKTLNELVSESSYRTIDAQTESGVVGKSNIYDRKGNALVTDVTSNIVIARNNKLTTFTNSSPLSGEGKSTLSGQDSSYRADTYLTKEITKAWVKYREQEVKAKDNRALTISLTPKAYNEADSKSEMWVMTSKATASDTDANNMKFDNLVEILVYSNPTGRRDVYSVPGNAMALATQGEATTKNPNSIEEIGFWKAGYNSKDYWMDEIGINEEMAYREKASTEWTRYPEDDAYAPEFVTIIAPTGITLREYIRNVIVPITILVIIVVVMLGIFGAKQVKIRKIKDEF